MAPRIWISESRSIVGSAHSATRITGAEEIEAIDHVQHGIAVDAVIRRVATLERIDSSAQIALIVENIVEL